MQFFLWEINLHCPLSHHLKKPLPLFILKREKWLEVTEGIKRDCLFSACATVLALSLMQDLKNWGKRKVQEFVENTYGEVRVSFLGVSQYDCIFETPPL